MSTKTRPRKKTSAQKGMDWDTFRHTPMYPSNLFGGTRGEVWTPDQTGQLFVGWMIVNDGVALLQRLLNTPSDAPDEDRSELIEEVSAWLDSSLEFNDRAVRPNASAETDLGLSFLEAMGNIGFLGESLGEHVNRLSHRQP